MFTPSTRTFNLRLKSPILFVLVDISTRCPLSPYTMLVLRHLTLKTVPKAPSPSSYSFLNIDQSVLIN
jgi:hypothetical protein